MEFVVEYDYEAAHEDELTLRIGDIITNVRVEEDGWMEGDLNGKRGLFPDNFVKEVKKESKEAKETRNEPKEEASPAQRREKSAGNVANLVQRMSTIGIPTGGFLPQPPSVAKKPKRRQCKVLFEYAPLNEDELELKVGEIVEIVEEVEEGWWNGTANGKTGLFPSNFVKELDPSGEEGDPVDTTPDEIDSSGLESSGTPTSPPAGNGVIAQPKKIRGVGFGDIFSQGSVKLRVRLPSPESEERKDKPIPSLPSAAKPAHPTMTDGDGKSKAKEYCKVMFAFEASNEDELSLKEGELIQILSKDTGEPGWWRGELGGKEGVFPDNFVAAITEAEKGSPKVAMKSSPRQEPEEKPKKPPPPSKSIAPKPEVPSADKKPHHIRTEDKDHKPFKPAAPVVPPKKPIPPPGKGRSASIPPKRPDKPLAPSPNLKHNGEVPALRPKSDFEPLLANKQKTLSGDWGDKPPTVADLMSFDDLSSTSEKLSHPTVNRPKMTGRRLPAQFGGGHSPNKEVTEEKSIKVDEDDGAKSKLIDARKSVANILPPSTPLHKPTPTVPETDSSPAAPTSNSISQNIRGRLESQDQTSQLDELRSQMKDLLMSVELIKAQQMKEISELRRELDEERIKRVTLQMEVEKLKRTVHLT